MGRSERTKGHNFEREIANRFKTVFEGARRHLEFQKEEAQAGVDISNTGRYKVQCKRGKRYAPMTAIYEVEIDFIEGGCPILVTQADRQPILAVLPFEELLDLIRLKERMIKKGFIK